MASRTKGLRGALAGALMAGALALGGCSTAGGGGSVLSAVPGLGNAPVVAALPVEVAPPPVVYGAFLDGPAGTRLPPADRTAALGAENGAVASGERRTWKGSKGVFGFVEPGPSTATAGTVPTAGGAPSECRSFTSTIYFGGRPQTGHGTGCRDADGSWHVTS